ncbi:LuxR C-terminal-related transcriptional regulator [Sinomonas sp. ASV322]|uniref:LuxR C-terminal-related transcriptional regulator n=1 Tax=Sinomonas sp. ASV322 TaxID=3041920 RepID=UPI0027DB311C|nr:LuxR C-terminal-related transcriptional regulator [Sinomonas sp. ASV322]MDQ4504329.1 LuxR C-terminal-related transcriptional regulator [Sinomonas sp. ASV322]
MLRDSAVSVLPRRTVKPSPESAERQADRLRWAMLVRQGELDAAVQALTDRHSLGTVVTGPPGVGKSFLASAVLNSLGSEIYPLRLRTSTTGPTSDYACLGALLARLPKGASSSPTGLMLAVERMLREDSGGHPAVLVVEFSGVLDEGSIGVLLHLLLSGTAKLLAVAQRATDLPADFLRLVRRSRLAEVPLRGIGIPETRLLVSTLVEGRVASSAVGELHHACGGNPSAVQGIVRRERATGNLHRRGGVWTLDGAVEPEQGSGTDEIIRARWAREPQDVREVIEHLAVARRVPIAGLAGLFGSEVLVDMEDRALIAVDASEHRCAYLREPRMAELVRERLGPDRHRELASLTSLGGAAEESGLDREDLVSYVEWTLGVGGTANADLVVHAARAAIALFEPRRALDLLDRAGEHDGHAVVEAAFQRAAALSLLERRDEALTVLDSVPRARLDELGPADLARHAAAKSELLAWLPERGEAREPLHVAWDSLALREEADASELRGAAEVLDLAEYRMHAFRGDFAPVLDALEAASRRTGSSEEFRREASLLLAQAWAACGREADAAALMSAFGFGPMGLASAQHPDDDAYLTAAFFVWIANGDWKRCVDLFEGYVDRGGRRLSLRGGIAELFLAMAYVMAGRGGSALEPALNAVAQLEEFPARNALRAAYATTAFAYAQVGDSGEASTFLERAAGCEALAPWLFAFISEFCEGMARRWLGEPGAAELLLGRAEEDEAAGRMSAAGIRVFGASIPGTDREFLWIERLGHRRQGPLAHLMAAVAAASRRKDAEALLDAAEFAYEMELDAVEARCAALALDFARDRGESAAAGRAQTRLDRLTRILPTLPLVPQVPAPVLTERERQIAVMAASGASNRDIADAVGVSVRTVEGHLYQVFMKLGVSSRSGLDGLV